jgi:5-methyltetrahydropteroyltriglutamate--homocysteine methyltransferase
MTMAAGSLLAACVLIMLSSGIVPPCQVRIGQCARRRFQSRAPPDDAQCQPHSDDSRRQSDSTCRTARAFTGGEGVPARAGALRATLHSAVADVVHQQIKAGIDIVNDGEFGKSSWSNYALERLTGFERRPDSNYEPVLARPRPHSFSSIHGRRVPRAPRCVPGHVCVAPITYRGARAIRRSIAALKDALAAVGVEDGFLTAVAPGSTGYDSSNEYYKDDHDYVFAVAERCAKSIWRSSNAGLILQVDDAVLANMYDELVQHGQARYRQWAELRVEALNHALRGIPEDRIRYHVCFGSWHVPHMADAPLDAIAPLI